MRNIYFVRTNSSCRVLTFFYCFVVRVNCIGCVETEWLFCTRWLGRRWWPFHSVVIVLHSIDSLHSGEFFARLWLFSIAVNILHSSQRFEWLFHMRKWPIYTWWCSAMFVPFVRVQSACFCKWKSCFKFV